MHFDRRGEGERSGRSKGEKDKAEGEQEKRQMREKRQIK